MTEDEFKYTTVASLARIEQKLNDFVERVVVVEERTWGARGTSTVIAVLLILATLFGGLGGSLANWIR